MHANLHLNAVTRSKGHSAVARAAYRAGDRLHDERCDRVFNYARRSGVEHAEIVAPADAPDWARNREQLWNKVESSERRKDAQLCKEAVLTLPRGLSPEQRQELVRGFIEDNFTRRGLVADYALHCPDASDGHEQPHAHIMFTLRPVEGEAFGKKLTGYQGGLDSRETLQEWRQSYEDHLNRMFEASGDEMRFDLRSLKEKGIDHAPQPKMGPAAAAMERKGTPTNKGRDVRRQQHRQPARRHVDSHQLIGGGSQHHAFVVEAMRADIARTYYEAAYGEEWAREDWER